MPKKAPELAAYQVKRLKRPGKHAVGGVAGLLLYVKPGGSRSWVFRVQVGDRRPDIGLGGYPDVPLEQARKRARDIREQIYQGIDPLEARRATCEALRVSVARRMTFDQAADQCHGARAHEFRSARHAQNWLNSLRMYASPKIGSLPVDQIELAHVLSVLEPIWTTKTETARRVRQRMEAVLAWAKVNSYRTGDNPAAWSNNLEHVLARPSKLRSVIHHPALPWQEIGGFMADLRERDGMAARALEFAILTAARSAEVRLATWDEIDMGRKLWTIPVDRMKAARTHRVPLSEPALKLLKASPRSVESPYVFPAARGGTLSDMSLSSVCRRMGVHAVPHGFRSTFKDWARSSTAYADEVSELALAHVSSDATRAAYARDELLEKRTRLMRDWAKTCATVMRTTDVVFIRKGERPSQHT
ncbi:MAG: integrase arm-type DNA-binding domain-containing protein [Pseudomonadales bacterium]